MPKYPLILAALLPLALPVASLADDNVVEVKVTLKDHRWDPAEIHVPTGKKVLIRVSNLDDTAEEFDSDALKVEKVIVGKGDGTVRLRPLGPGQYKFQGEYHPDTAQGVVIAE